MLLTVVLPLLLAGVASAAPANVCSSAPYSLFLPLSTFAPATSFCSSKYPVAPVTSVATSTIVSTITSTASSATTNTVVSSVSQTVDSTSVETDTTTITVSVTAVVTAGANKAKREAEATVASAAKGPFQVDEDVQKRSFMARGVTTKKSTTTTKASTTTTKPTSTTSSKVDLQASKWSSLSAAIGSKLSTACSCIETKPTVHSTTTTTQYTTVPQTVINTVQTTVYTTITITNVESDTTATTTTTTTTVATSTLQPAVSCAAGGTAAGGGSLGCTYHTYCNTLITFDGSTVVPNGATTLSDCTVQCDNDPNCLVAQFNTVTNTCTFLDGLSGPNGCGAFQYTSNPDYDSAVFVADGHCGSAGQSCSGS